MLQLPDIVGTMSLNGKEGLIVLFNDNNYSEAGFLSCIIFCFNDIICPEVLMLPSPHIYGIDAEDLFKITGNGCLRNPVLVPLKGLGGVSLEPRFR